MILPIKYDNYRDFDVNRQLHEQARDFRTVQQELLKQQLYDQQQEMERRRRSLTTQKQKEEQLFLQNLQKQKAMHLYMEGRNKEYVKNDLSKWYENNLNNQRADQEQRRQEQFRLEQQIVETAKFGQTMAKLYEQQKKDYFKQVSEQQYTQHQIKKQQQRYNKKIEQNLYQEQVDQENEKIQQKLNGYKKFYEDVSQRQAQLQAMYVENSHDPKAAIDDIIQKNMQLKQQNDERNYLYRKELESKQKKQYNSILSMQLQESEQKKHQSKLQARSNGYSNQDVYRSFSERPDSEKISTVDLYNPLTNPNPNQIQNPYLLKQLGLNLNEIPSPAYTRSRLASVGRCSVKSERE